MKRKKTSKGILIDVALLLVCLLCITTCISSGILARYTTGANGRDGAKLAKFSVSASAEPDPNDPMEYSVTVVNGSETAVRYSLELVFDQPVEGIITVNVNGKEYGASGNTISLPALGILGAAGKTEQIELSFTANNLTVPINFDTFVRFEQID
ncbi:MAG: hypothetical protein J5544_03490 [Clostridia bacterium]|nr:hypothetical protein [Clostridia bacterium]